MFTEYTYTDGVIEVMVHHNKRGNVIAVYTYVKDAQSINESDNERGEPMKPFDWQPGKNSLFVHLPKGQIRRFVREFIDSNELVCAELEDPVE